MFELKYKITDRDMSALNKSIMWLYFIPYLVVSLAGIAAGISAVMLDVRAELFVLGIILIVLGSILLVCSVLLALSPKNFVVSALVPSDDVERTLRFDDGGITILTPDRDDIFLRYGEIAKLKDKKTYLVAYLTKEQVLIIKDAITTGQSLSELQSFLSAKLGAIVSAADSAAIAQQPAQEQAQEEAQEEAQQPAQEEAQQPAQEQAQEEGQEQA